MLTITMALMLAACGEKELEDTSEEVVCPEPEAVVEEEEVIVEEEETTEEGEE